MAKKSLIERNRKRERMTAHYAARREALKALVADRELPLDERFDAHLKLAALPRNGAAVRVRRRCVVTGRGRGVYRKLRMSRIALREFGGSGLIPGMVKSSW